MKYGFMIDSLSAQDAVESESCIYKLFAFMYFKKYNNKAERAILRAHAMELKKNEEDLDQNWLFVYETLPQSELPGDWKTLKQNGISFIQKEYQV
jgi:hypothetical protein